MYVKRSVHETKASKDGIIKDNKLIDDIIKDHIYRRNKYYTAKISRMLCMGGTIDRDIPMLVIQYSIIHLLKNFQE